MANQLHPNEELHALADGHRRWLAAFDPRYPQSWKRLFANDYEAAMTEASVRRMLECAGVSVAPNEDLAGDRQQPDFRCSVHRCCRMRRFFSYVEVTSVSIEKAIEVTGIPLEPRGASHYRPLTDAIFHACKGKAKQYSGLDAPALLVIGTFHSTAAMVCFAKPKLGLLLTGETGITWDIDPPNGAATGEPYQTTNLRSAAFLRPDASQGVGYSRSSLSGVLLCSVGLESQRSIGVLHPNPARPFIPAALPTIEFGRVTLERASQYLRVEWPRQGWKRFLSKCRRKYSGVLLA